MHPGGHTAPRRARRPALRSLRQSNRSRQWQAGCQIDNAAIAAAAVAQQSSAHQHTVGMNLQAVAAILVTAKQPDKEWQSGLVCMPRQQPVRSKDKGWELL